MARNELGQNKYSGVITCGASAAFLNHQPGEPTMFDSIASAFKRLTNGADANARNNQRSATAQGIAG